MTQQELAHGYRREFKTTGHLRFGFEINGGTPHLDEYLTRKGITPLEYFKPIKTLIDTGDKAIYVTYIDTFYTGLLIKMIDHHARVEWWITSQVDTMQYRALANNVLAEIDKLSAEVLKTGRV